MALNNFHVQIATADQGIQKVDTAKGLTYFGDIFTDNGRKRAYMKLLNIDGICREAICAVLAKKLYLPVPQPYYVNVDPSYVERKAGNTQCIAFGLEEASPPFRRILDIEAVIERELSAWQELERCAVFDSWIGNSDRLPNNLLYGGQGLFWMIDHEEALSSLLSPEQASKSQLFNIIKNKYSYEFQRFQTRERMLKFALTFNDIDWDVIKDCIHATELEGAEIIIEKHFSFLKQRLGNIKSILNLELDIRQQDIDFTHNEKLRVTKDGI